MIYGGYLQVMKTTVFRIENMIGKFLVKIYFSA